MLHQEKKVASQKKNQRQQLTFAWCNLEHKQKLKNKGQLLLGGDPKATTNLCRCNGKKRRFLLGGDPEEKTTINLCGGWCKPLQKKRKKEQLACGNEKEK